MAGVFSWCSTKCSPPGRWDLRLLGWSLVPRNQVAQAGASVPRLLDWRTGTRGGNWRDLSDPTATVVVGVDDSAERADMLAAGVGEALSPRISLVELGARLTRLVARANALPRHREAGQLTLDLFHRDGRIDGRWLGLHPREFGLLWRLADAPGTSVRRDQLLADVWRLKHIPETNSLEVHVSRLRSKLAATGVPHLVETDPAGGYRLNLSFPESFAPRAVDRCGHLRDDGSNATRERPIHAAR